MQSQRSFVQPVSIEPGVFALLGGLQTPATTVHVLGTAKHGLSGGKPSWCLRRSRHPHPTLRLRAEPDIHLHVRYVDGAGHVGNGVGRDAGTEGALNGVVPRHVGWPARFVRTRMDRGGGRLSRPDDGLVRSVNRATRRSSCRLSLRSPTARRNTRIGAGTLRRETP